jgi:muconolactone delta-isomerase
MQFLMIAKPKPGVSREQLGPHLKGEVAITLQYFSTGKIRQLHFLADEPGAVFLWEADSREELQQWLEEYPMRQAGLIEFEVIALKPYAGFSAL